MEAQAGPLQAEADRLGQAAEGGLHVARQLDTASVVTPEWDGAGAHQMGLQGCLWGSYAFVVGGSQEELYPAYPDLSSGLLNLNR